MNARLRKRIVNERLERSIGGEPGWLDLTDVAEVAVSSEDPERPIEHALVSPFETGWRASGPGPQIVRILFDAPRTIHRLYLHFEESAVERTQEFTLAWGDSAEGPLDEIVRQQWNFSPTGSSHQIEDYRPTPREVSVVELRIVPDVSGGEARASLEQFRLG